MTRVLALLKYGTQAATTRQRLLQYRPALHDAGIEVEAIALLDNDYLKGRMRGGRTSLGSVAATYVKRMWELLSRRDFDVLWVYAELFPYLPGVFEPLAFLSGKPVIYDFDDAIFHQYDQHRRPVVRGLLGGKLEPLLRGARACCCGSAYLLDYAGRFCPRSVFLPTVVDTTKYLPIDRPTGTRPVVGWIGSPSTWPYLEAMMPLLQGLVAKGAVDVRVVGAGDHAAHYPSIHFIPWSEESEIAEIQQMDIGIMPVPDEPWARGKCGYKLVQYMACGLPVVASPVGANAQIVDEGESGFLATSADEWQAALCRLSENAPLRHRMGLAGRERIVRDYSLAACAPRLVQLIAEVAG